MGVAADPDDDMVIATAISSDVDYLVTGDKGLLDVGEQRGVQIVSPRRFLALLATQ